jgi:hypothetical protein
MAEVKIGAFFWNQYTDWKSLRAAAISADRLGVNSLDTWDHLHSLRMR